MKKPVVKVEFIDNPAENSKGNSRRRFIKMGGLAFAGSTLLYACSEDDDFDPTGGPEPTPNPGPGPGPGPDPVFDLGAGNLGILNYAYALEQLESDFYTRVTEGAYYQGLADDSEEKQILEDVWYHEVIHREFFRAAITAVAPDDITPDLAFDYGDVDFDNRESVLNTALLLEDTGVSAYNGAGKLIDVEAENGGLYLLLAGKIVSVEARHASAFADLALGTDTAFARDEILVSISEVGPAFDKATPPADVLAAAGGFITTEFTANQLPTD